MSRLALFGVVVLLLVSGCEKKPQVTWEAYSPETLDDASRSGQPIVAYFYAAWCPPCYKLKEKTFSDPRVIDALAPFRKIKFDMSWKRSEEVLGLNRRFRVRALPEIHLISHSDEVTEGLRIRGFVGPDRFLSIMDQFRNRQIPYQTPADSSY